MSYISEMELEKALAKGINGFWDALPASKIIPDILTPHEWVFYYFGKKPIEYEDLTRALAYLPDKVNSLYRKTNTQGGYRNTKIELRAENNSIGLELMNIPYKASKLIKAFDLLGYKLPTKKAYSSLNLDLCIEVIKALDSLLKKECVSFSPLNNEPQTIGRALQHISERAHALARSDNKFIKNGKTYAGYKKQTNGAGIIYWLIEGEHLIWEADYGDTLMPIFKHALDMPTH